MALERVLDDGLSSRLQRNLCERRGLLYDISAMLEGYTDVGLVDVSFRIAEKNAVVALREVLRELVSLREKPLGPGELSKVKSRMWREAVALHEGPRFLAQRLAEHALLDLRTPLELEKWRRTIDALGPEDVRSAAARVFRGERLVALFEGEVPAADQRQLRRLIKNEL